MSNIINDVVTVNITRETMTEVLLNIHKIMLTTEDFITLANIVAKSKYSVYLPDLPAINGVGQWFPLQSQIEAS